MNFVNDYQKNAFPFPPDDIDPKEKNTPDWLLAAAKATYAKYVQNSSAFFYTDNEKFEVQRKYGQARQDVDIYKELYKPTEDEGDHAAKGYVNLDFKVFSPVLKYKAILRQRVSRMMAEPQVRAIDEMSGLEREEQKFNDYFAAINQDIIGEYEQITGDNVEKPDIIPSSMEELEIYSQMKGVKLKSEAAYDRGLKYTDEISNFKSIQRKLMDDIIDIGACCMKDYVDPEDGLVKMKYIDVARFVGDYSLNHGFDKSRFFGHFEDYKIHELRFLMPDIPEDEWKMLAYNYSGHASNPGLADWSRYDVQYDSDGFGGKKWGYDDYTIMVMEGEVKTVDTKYRTKHTSGRGDVKYYDDEFGKVRNTQSKETSKRSVMTWYKFNWVVGSDHIFDSGPQTDIPRPEKSKPRSSYHPFRQTGKSFVELIQTNLDQIMLAYLRMQNAINASTPDGLAIQWDALEGISLGDDEETGPMELLRIHQQTGNLIYRATTHRGNVNMSAAKPVIPLTGGTGKMFEDSIRAMEMNFNWIAELTGIDRFSAGMTPSPETSATASQIAAQGANEIVEDMAFGFQEVRKSAANNVAHRIALRVKHSKKAYDTYHPALGINTEILKITADRTPQMMGIYMKVAPNFETKRSIMENVKVAIQAGQIGPDDAIRVERAIEEGNLLYAEALLGHTIKKNGEREQQNQQANIEAQNQGLLTIKQEETKSAMNKAEADKVAALEIQAAKDMGAINLENAKHRNKMAQIKEEKGMQGRLEEGKDGRAAEREEGKDVRGFIGDAAKDQRQGMLDALSDERQIEIEKAKPKPAATKKAT
jgi:hypothetical protein